MSCWWFDLSEISSRDKNEEQGMRPMSENDSIDGGGLACRNGASRLKPTPREQKNDTAAAIRDGIVRKKAIDRTITIVVVDLLTVTSHHSHPFITIYREEIPHWTQ
jgi:hypothetical protein